LVRKFEPTITPNKEDCPEKKETIKVLPATLRSLCQIWDPSKEDFALKIGEGPEGAEAGGEIRRAGE
jgi:hypothetical protein